MAFREITKNSRDYVRISPNEYMGHDLVDIRIYASDRQDPDTRVATRRGVSINIDLVPDLIDALVWALGQPCSPNDLPEVPGLSPKDADDLASTAHAVLKAHGSSVHWDSAEKLVLGQAGANRFTKWQLHQVLTHRSDLFQHTGAGCFKAR